MSITKLGDCEGEDCDRINVPIVNAKRGLCEICNRKRLHPEGEIPYQFKYKASLMVGRVIKSSRPKQISDKGRENKEKDEIFYEALWDSKPHYCEECDVFLGDDFRDHDGKIIDRFRYSHILPKGGMYGIFRHRLENGNLLCLRDHNKWEHGIQTDMKIYPSNKIVMDNLSSELIEINGKGQKRTGR